MTTVAVASLLFIRTSTSSHRRRGSSNKTAVRRQYIDDDGGGSHGCVGSCGFNGCQLLVLVVLRDADSID